MLIYNQILPSTCCPFRSIQRAARRIISLIAFRTIRRLFWLLNSSTIRCLKTARDRGGLVKIFDLMYPHRKKSQGVKSGERAGQSLSPSQVITRPGNISCKRSCTISARCAGAPSCAHHKRSKCSSCICSLKCCTKTGKASSTIISWYFCLL